MQLSEYKRQMLYKNEAGGKIGLRITLPKTIEESDVNKIYEALENEYKLSAQRFISSREDNGVYFLDVSYEIETLKKYVKVKRLSTVKCGKKTLKAKIINDWFEKDTFRLKR